MASGSAGPAELTASAGFTALGLVAFAVLVLVIWSIRRHRRSLVAEMLEHVVRHRGHFGIGEGRAEAGHCHMAFRRFDRRAAQDHLDQVGRAGIVDRLRAA